MGRIIEMEKKYIICERRPRAEEGNSFREIALSWCSFTYICGPYGIVNSKISVRLWKDCQRPDFLHRVPRVAGMGQRTFTCFDRNKGQPKSHAHVFHVQ